jgi:hypothetical protein
MDSEKTSETNDVISQDPDSLESEMIVSQSDESEHEPAQELVQEPVRKKIADAPKPIKPSPALEKLKASLESSDSQTRAKTYLEFMKAQLDPHHVNFRDFWLARKECALSFRPIADIQLKASFLEQLQALCTEAKGLKNLLEEQSQFAIEQIDLAIDGLEKELEMISLSQDIHWQPTYYPRMGRFDDLFYAQRQGLLNWLNGFSSRISAFRKELIKTDMRVRSKNKLFSRLSDVGDKVFPQRKELIREVSEQFLKDVEEFSYEIMNAPNLHVLSSKDEVKVWQNLAKELTLNTHAFKKTRELLSGGWERLKKLDKEFQAQRNLLKNERKEKFQVYTLQIEEIKKLQAANQIPEKVLVSRLDELFKKSKKEHLGRDDQETLKGLIDELKKPIFEREQLERAQEFAKRQENQRQREQVMISFEAKFRQNIEAGQLELKEMKQDLESLHERVNLRSDERHRFESMLQSRREENFDERMQELMLKANDVQQSEAEEILRDLFDCRVELRQQLDIHKRHAGASGLDFQKAIELNDRITRERERIGQLDESIKKVQNRL